MCNCIDPESIPRKNQRLHWTLLEGSNKKKTNAVNKDGSDLDNLFWVYSENRWVLEEVTEMRGDDKD